MSDNLIKGINPLIISKILAFDGWRLGVHPAKLRYLQQKNPIRGVFGFYEPMLFDGYRRPTVKIYGSDGDPVKIITCRSNIHAVALKNSLEAQLNSFLSNIRIEND